VQQNKIMELQKINDLAKQYFDQKDFSSALNVLTSVQLPPELIPNLAKCYYYTRQAHRALELIKPLNKNHNLWIDQALYHNAIGETQRAYEIYKSLDKSDPKVKFNMGWHLLAENKFKEGFDHLQYGAECNAWGHEYIHVRNGVLNPRKRWHGNPCYHLVLILEGGLGDEIIFLRWAKHLKSKCNKLSVVCSEGLMRLLTNSGYNCIPFRALNHIEYDYYCPAMSLPTITELNHPQDQVQFPYITSFAEPYITNQLDRLANGRLKIGIRFLW
jgi:tetratricopeptide (TPR) repeat protein